jgi:signal peptidase I
MVIYFSLVRTSPSDVEQVPEETAQPPADDKLGHERELAAKVAAFARWRRIFRVVH